MIDNIKYARFETETELLKSVLLYLGKINVYPKVSAIAGKKINPDIDILQIKRVSQNRYGLVGYEIKLMKFDKRSKGLSWNVLYQGVGQALLYFLNGIHRAVLVLGFHKNVPNDEIIEKFYNLIWTKKELLNRIIGSYLSLDIYLYKRSSISPIIKSNYDFYPSDNETKFLSEALLQKRFTFNKKLLELI